MPGNNLPRIKLIRGKLFPDRYLLSDCLLISVAFVVLCRVGGLWVSQWDHNVDRNGIMAGRFVLPEEIYMG